MGSVHSAILLICAPDKEGLVYTITEFIYRHHGNILHAEQHIDETQNSFFMRIEWDLSNFTIPDDAILAELSPIRSSWNMDLQLFLRTRQPITAIFVSRTDHCLVDLLYKWKNGDLPVQIAAIFSNHESAGSLADTFRLPFYFLPVFKENKQQVEQTQLSILAQLQVDFVILARYMQVLSPEFIRHYPNRIINVHHSFLPAFSGAKPYEQAFLRGVKLVGSTAHYVTDVLDDGPIIGQQVMPVSHQDNLDEFIAKGQDLEKHVLSYAVKKHIEHKILVFANKTIVFD